MPEKQALVFIKNKEGRVVFLKSIVNLSMLFPEDTHIKDEQGNSRQDAVQFEIHGIVDGMQLANHYIHLKGRGIPVKAGATAYCGADVAESKAAKEAMEFSDVDFSNF